MKKIYITLSFLIITSNLSAQLVLTETLYDPPNGISGDANRDGTRELFGDEFIELVNIGATDLDITGYKIYDKEKFDALPSTDEPRHIVPSNTIIPSGGIFVVFGGTVNDLDSDLSTIQSAFPEVIFQRSTSGVLDLQDKGDDIYINDASGKNIITFKSDDFFLGMGGDMSATRRANTLDAVFTRHRAVNKTNFSPGELIYFVNTFPLVLNEALLDPGGADVNGDGVSSNTEDEFIEFVNISGASVDISGFQIFDDGNVLDGLPRHVIPKNTIIPNDSVYLIFGGGTPTGTFGNSTVQTASSGSLHLSNNSEIIYVTDPSNNLVFSIDSAEFLAGISEDQSVTRSPDLTGGFVLHSDAQSGVNFSPGTKADGTTLSIANYLPLDQQVIIYKTNHNTLDILGLQHEKADIRIFDIQGKEILKKSFDATDTKEVVLPFISKGVYIVSINTDGGKINRKIILDL